MSTPIVLSTSAAVLEASLEDKSLVLTGSS